MKVFLTITLLIVAIAGTVQAQQNAPVGPIKFLHHSVTEADLPFPGEELNLEVALAGTRDYKRNIRIYGLLDGKSFQAQTESKLVDEQDRPLFVAHIPSPRYTLSYWFVLLDANKPPLSSPAVVLRRKCSPSIEPVAGSVDEKLPPAQRIEALAVAARRLELEVASRKRVLGMRDRINELLLRRQQAQADAKKASEVQQ